MRRLLVVVVGALATAAMVLMGVWQLSVYQAQGAQSAAARAAAPPVELSDVAPAGAAVQDGFGRSVHFGGTYDPALQLLVPDRSRRDTFRVLTGLRQPDGSIVAVVRGVVAVPVAPPPPEGRVQQTGILLPSEEQRPAPSAPDQVGSVRLPALAQRWPGPLVAGFVTLSPQHAAKQGLTPATVELPRGDGRLRNGAYALQWWIFAAFAVVLTLRIARDTAAHELGTPDAEIADDELTRPT